MQLTVLISSLFFFLSKLQAPTNLIVKKNSKILLGTLIEGYFLAPFC